MVIVAAFIVLAGCVRTIVVWKLAVENSEILLLDGCVRTIVVWKPEEFFFDFFVSHRVA